LVGKNLGIIGNGLKSETNNCYIYPILDSDYLIMDTPGIEDISIY
jgi:hypothetical protein